MSDHRDDIERYLRGDMTPDEMHAPEKKALEDPFLADALEGGSAISPAQFSSDVKALKQRVSEKTKTSGGIRWYYQAAAAVLVVGVSAAMIFYLSSREGVNTPIALNAPSQSELQQQPPAADTTLSQPAPADDEQEPYDTRAEAPGVARDEAPQISANSERDVPGEEQVILKRTQEEEIAPLEAEDPSAEPALAQTQETAPGAVKIEPPQGARSLRARAETDGRTAEGRIVKGRVTDAEDGMPLPGVNVMVSGAPAGTVTDLNGYYEISVSPTAQALVFSFVGLNSVEAAVPGGEADTATLDVKMGPDISALSEVVVVGYGEETERGFEEIKWEPAEPEGGKRAFRRYLETNMKYPRVALENNIEGRVTVQFTIEPTGDLTDFRVVRGLGYGCDEEVIRLIREGPRWKPTKRNDQPVRGKGKVKLKFALPEGKK